MFCHYRVVSLSTLIELPSFTVNGMHVCSQSKDISTLKCEALILKILLSPFIYMFLLPYNNLLLTHIIFTKSRLCKPKNVPFRILSLGDRNLIFILF